MITEIFGARYVVNKAGNSLEFKSSILLFFFFTPFSTYSIILVKLPVLRFSSVERFLSIYQLILQSYNFFTILRVDLIRYLN